MYFVTSEHHVIRIVNFEIGRNMIAVKGFSLTITDIDRETVNCRVLVWRMSNNQNRPISVENAIQTRWNHTLGRNWNRLTYG